MWNKRREDEFPQRPGTASAATPAEPVREPMPVREPAPVPTATTPRPAEAELPRGVAAIGKSVVIKGQIFSREDLYLDGEMEGTVEVPEHRLTVGPHCRLQAGIKAREVVVLGAVNGNVEALEKIDIRKDARLVGDIKTGRIMIEDGAYFKGSIDIVREAQQPARPAPQPRPVVASSSVAPTPVMVGNDQKH